MIADQTYKDLSAKLDVAFQKMEVAWIHWRENRRDELALETYIKTLAECHDLHHILKSFPQYEPFSTNFPTSPSNDGVGYGKSHGVSSRGCVDGERVDLRTTLGGGGANLCARRFPPLDVPIPRGVAFGEPGGAGKPPRNTPDIGPETPAVTAWWLAAGTVVAVPVVAVVVDWALHLL